MSDVSICNSALMRLGAERINSLTEDNKKGVLCSEHYNKARKHLLRSHLWNFSIKRIQLAKTANTPVFEYTDEYQLPSDYLKIVRLHDQSIEYRIEGDKLLCNADTIKIQYISDITDTSKFTPDFSETLALKLAVDMCIALTQDRLLKRDLLNELQIVLRDARSMDAQEGTPVDLIDDYWINSRL